MNFYLSVVDERLRHASDQPRSASFFARTATALSRNMPCEAPKPRKPHLSAGPTFATTLDRLAKSLSRMLGRSRDLRRDARVFDQPLPSRLPTIGRAISPRATGQVVFGIRSKEGLREATPQASGPRASRPKEKEIHHACLVTSSAPEADSARF